MKISEFLMGFQNCNLMIVYISILHKIYHNLMQKLFTFFDYFTFKILCANILINYCRLYK